MVKNKILIFLEINSLIDERKTKADKIPKFYNKLKEADATVQKKKV